ncbi:MAG: HDIG domain-containing protein [Acetobacteraceae bacterium]|nr:HDIG domain-containing protein [Acetobacteraceae bacterium]
MDPYTIDRSSNFRRQAVADWLFGLELVAPELREKIVTAWVSTWSSSPYAELAEMPYSPGAPHYRLQDHVNDVTRAGLDLAQRAAADWGQHADPNVLVPILILHDVDKPLMYVRESADKVGYSQLSRELQHGVVGAMLLKELGFDHTVISTVATHAGNSPFHGSNFEAYVLHYADYFATDHAIMREPGDRQPYYQKHWR